MLIHRQQPKMQKHFFGGELSPWQISQQHNNHLQSASLYPYMKIEPKLQYSTARQLKPKQKFKVLDETSSVSKIKNSRRRHTFFISSTSRELEASPAKKEKTLATLSNLQTVFDNCKKKKDSKTFTLNFLKRKCNLKVKVKTNQSNTAKNTLDVSCFGGLESDMRKCRIRSHSVFI